MQFDILQMQVQIPGTFTGNTDACMYMYYAAPFRFHITYHFFINYMFCTDEEYMLANSKDHLNGNNKGIWPSHLIFFSNA